MAGHRRVATTGVRARSRHFGLAPGLAALLVGPFVGRAAATQSNPSPAPSERALLAEARKDLLNLSELPAGWTVQKGSGNSGNSGNSGDTGNSGNGQADEGYEMLVRVSSCAGIPRSPFDANPPTANGKTFQANDQTIQVNDEVGVFGTAAQARRFSAVWANPKVAFCLALTLSKGSGHSFLGLTKGMKLGQSSGSVLEPPETQGGESGIALVMPITYRGITLKANMTIADAARGRLSHLMILISFVGRAPGRFQGHLLSLIADP
jgi:hypothetical protein